MLDYSKVFELLKKEFPDISQQEIDDMILQIPADMPLYAVKAVVKITKQVHNNPAKAKLLQKMQKKTAKR